MTLMRWQPFHEMDTLRRQFDQMLDEVTGVSSKLGGHVVGNGFAPAVELKDENDRLILRAAVPGMDAKDLDVRVTRDAVAIAGEHHQDEKESDGHFFRSEFRYGKFQRTIPLPVSVQNDNVTADFKDGILTLTLPKIEELQHKVVKLDLT